MVNDVMTVNQIKEALITEGRYNREEIKQLSQTVKGKKAWKDIYDDGEKQEYDWKEIDTIEDITSATIYKKITEKPTITQEEVEQPRPKTPHYKDEQWNDYVMSQFAPHELIDGKYPNVNALRRVVELLLGEIAFSGPIETQTTLMDGIGKAVVTYKVVIDWKLDALYAGLVGSEGYPQRTFLAVASSWIGNTDDVYAVFPESIAETRAEGRALRRALRLNVVCADELTKKDTAAVVQQQKDAAVIATATNGNWNENGLITTQQENTIKLMCNRLGIDLLKFINSGSKTYDDITQVTRVAAAGMLKQLNRYQSSGSDALDIPQNLIGD